MKWPEYPMAKLVERFISGGTPNTKNDKFWIGDIPWITGADFKDGEAELGRKFINESAVKKTASNVVPVGAILMVTRTGVGKIALAREDTAISQDITGIVPKKTVNADYLMAAIRTRMERLLAAQRGATIKGITRKDVATLPIPLPAQSEQRRIVEILDQADALRKKRVEADAKAQRILPALFYDMFGDPALNPKNWKADVLGKVILETQYGTSQKADADGDGQPILRMNNIDMAGNLDLTKLKFVKLSDKDLEKYKLLSGDLLFNRTNSKELVGKTGIWNGELSGAVSASYLIRVRVDQSQATPEFIWAYMNTPYFKKILFNKSRAAIGMANINAKELRQFPVIVPDTDLQDDFSKLVHEMRDQAAGWSTSAKNLDGLFSSLLYRAFAGDLTAQWREAHMKELLQEMEQQAKVLRKTP